MTTPLRLGVAGWRTVGIGVVKIVQKHADLLQRRTGRPIQITAVSAKKQRELARAIKRARFLALLPYAVK